MVTLDWMFASGPELSNLIGKFINLLYQWIGNFGWTVVVFTILLKVLVSPLDLWQKRIARKNSRAMKRMEAPLAKLREAYKDNPQALQRKQMELYKANGYSTFGPCLPSLLTMVIFFVVFSGFNAEVKYENQMIVYDLTTSYQDYVLDTGLIDNKIDDLFLEENKEKLSVIESYGINVKQYAQDYKDIIARNDENVEDQANELIDKLIDQIMLEAYNSHSVTDAGVKKWEWLWVDNVFMGDSWADVVPTLETYVGTGLGKLNSTLPDANFRIRPKYENNIYNALLKPAQDAYNKKKTFDIKNWNGYLILPLLSIALSILSTKLMRGTTPQTQSYDANGKPIDNEKQMRMMNWFMPIMIGIFSLFYSAAFTIYMFFNSLITVLINLTYNLITKKKDAIENGKVVKR